MRASVSENTNQGSTKRIQRASIELSKNITIYKIKLLNVLFCRTGPWLHALGVDKT